MPTEPESSESESSGPNNSQPAHSQPSTESTSTESVLTRRLAARGPSQITGGLMLLVIVSGLLGTRMLTRNGDRESRSTTLDSPAEIDAGLGSEPLSPVYRVDINKASLGELLNLPSIGPTTAAKILAHREQLGKFQQLSDLQNVPGIGPQTLKQIEPYLLFPEPTAADAQVTVPKEPGVDGADTILMATKPEQATP